VTPLKIRPYKKLSPRLFEVLYERFTFKTGAIRIAIKNSTAIKFFVAFLDKEIVGWAVIYKGFYCDINSNDVSIGVFVKKQYRHCGIGNGLRKRALTWAVNKNIRPWWYDRHQSYAAYKVYDINMIPVKDDARASVQC
jgi:GNAT superfamily N-acetyltransferase